ncbi:hypothetical protein [Rhodococcus sp. YH1]|uniref:hypothetical protein n=1 Tax=Rhodococcus sp. YH1 TaxID=89066 RepID=UPI00138755CF|nr:hypothetical protein [Rhodococcus sp. YH1]NCL78917.1 hypothetical protein [Rhodococcus sp. YH1]
MTDRHTCTTCGHDLPPSAYSRTTTGARRTACLGCFAQAIQRLHGRPRNDWPGEHIPAIRALRKATNRAAA